MITLESATQIKSGDMNSNFDEVLATLTSHLESLDAIVASLDNIEEGAGGNYTGTEIVQLLNPTSLRIDQNNCPSDILDTYDISSAITTHINATVAHAANYVAGTTTGYSTTPGGFVTASERTALDEVNNLRYELHKLLGMSTWVDTPQASLETLGSMIGGLNTTTMRRGVRYLPAGDNYLTIGSNDYLFVCATSVNPCHVFLPVITSALHGREISIKCDSTLENNLVIHSQGSNTIDRYNNTSIGHDDVFQENYWSARLIARFDVGKWDLIL
jgi:hypothetical protein